MLLASSIRYGGLLVSPEDCDYTSFKHLGLLCPICKRSVFLVAPKQRGKHTRKNKAGQLVDVKESSVSAYFAHHPEVDRSTVDDCELRSTKISPLQRLAAENNSRNQRAKILRTHFWKILLSNPKLDGIDEAKPLIETLLFRSSVYNELHTKRIYQLLIDELCGRFTHPQNIEFTKKTITNGLLKWREDIVTGKVFVPIRLQNYLNIWSNTLDLKMQSAIVCEALDYICSKKQRAILEKLVSLAIYNWLLAVAIASTNSNLDPTQLDKIFNSYSNLKPVALEQINTMGSKMTPYLISASQRLIGIDNEQLSGLYYFVRDDVANSLGMVDWAGEFERLEK
jgi:hypothetical protein